MSRQLHARVGGFQLVLIGDTQDLPLVHLSTKPFSLNVNDWSSDVSNNLSKLRHPMIDCSLHWHSATRQDGHVHHDQLLQSHQFALGTSDGPLGIRIDGQSCAVRLLMAWLTLRELIGRQVDWYWGRRHDVCAIHLPSTTRDEFDSCIHRISHH